MAAGSTLKVTSISQASASERARVRIYEEAIAAERRAERDSILAAWETGMAFRRFEDPVPVIRDMTGYSETYIYKRIRIAGEFTKAQLITAIDRSCTTHFTAFYSWAFNEGTHENNQMFKRRNLHIPEVHCKFFESQHIDAAELVKAFLAVIPPSELYALLRKYVPGE